MRKKKHISYWEIVRHRLSFGMGMNTWPIGTRHSYSSELDILPDRSPAPGFTALATTDVCTTPPAAPAQSTRLHMNQLEEIDKPLLMTKTAHQKMNKPVVSHSSHFLQSNCSQAYRQMVHYLKNKLPSWHTRNHWAQRISCKQQKDEGKELCMSWKQVEQFLNIHKKQETYKFKSISSHKVS